MMKSTGSVMKAGCWSQDSEETSCNKIDPLPSVFCKQDLDENLIQHYVTLWRSREARTGVFK